MMEKETYWSKFADDLEERTNYVVGKNDIEIIKTVISEQKNLGKTLELGCGNGTYSKVLIREADDLTATDFSDEMVAVSKNRLKGIENIIVEKANCFNLSYPDSSFDTVFMANLLHIIPGPQKAVAEAKTVLSKNGKLIVISFTTEGMTFFSRLGMVYRYLKTYGKPPPSAQTLTVQKTRKMLEKCGFKIEEAKLEGFFFYLLSGFFAGSVIHYLIAKVAGPVLFNRSFCGWACWTARIRSGRPSVDKRVQKLIKKMIKENPLWGAPILHGELIKLGITYRSSG